MDLDSISELCEMTLKFFSKVLEGMDLGRVLAAGTTGWGARGVPEARAGAV